MAISRISLAVVATLMPLLVGTVLAVEVDNLVGIYTDGAMSANTATAEPGDYLTLYVVLHDPHNPHRNEDVAQVGCAAFGLDLSLNLEFVAKKATTDGKQPDCTGNCTYFRSCFGAQLPVDGDRRITLRSFVVRYFGPGPAEIRLRPDVFELLDGDMDYWYRDPENTGWVLPMYPVTGSYELPAFVINGAVPTAAESWGNLKARYR